MQKAQNKRFSLGSVIYNMATIGWLVMVEIYLWSTKFDIILNWIIELLPLWVGGMMGVSGTLFLLFYYGRIRKRKRGTFKIRRFLNRLIVISLGVFRVIEITLIATHLKEFFSWWPGGFLTYASVGWLVAILCVLVSFRLFDELSKEATEEE